MYLPQSYVVGDSIAVYGDFEICMKEQIIKDDYIFSCLVIKNMKVIESIMLELWLDQGHAFVRSILSKHLEDCPSNIRKGITP